MSNSTSGFPLLCAALLATSGCAVQGDRVAASHSRRDCFFPSQITGFSGAEDDRVLIHTGPTDNYLFETFGYCPDLDFTQRLAVDTIGAGAICSGLDVNLIVPSALGPRQCPIRMIRKLSKAEISAQ